MGLSSVELVTWVCTRAEPNREALFGASPCPLSQGVLLSLMQQLASDLQVGHCRFKPVFKPSLGYAHP
jgi:enhancer of mRNA-decapping protein 4